MSAAGNNRSRAGAGAGPAAVDEYLKNLPPDQRAALGKVRAAILAAAPGAEEVISYRMPMFKLNGQLVGIAAFKDHCSLVVMSPSVIEQLADDLAGYDTSKGTIRFPAGKPPPAALVKKIVKARIAENEARKSQRQAR